MSYRKKIHYLKQAMVSLLLLVYVTGLVKPLMPIVQDMLAHTFYKMEHMATVHYENGKYHVHTELQQEAQKSEPQKKSTAGDSETLSLHVKSEDTLFELYLQQLSQVTSPYIDGHADVILSMPLLPPRC